jgi:hypothetical protein
MNPNLKRMLAQRAKTNAAAAPGIERADQRKALEADLNARKGQVVVDYIQAIGVEEFAERHLGIPKKVVD